MDVKRNPALSTKGRDKILIGWWVGIDKISSADEIGRGKLNAFSVAGSKGSSARTMKLFKPAIEMLFF